MVKAIDVIGHIVQGERSVLVDLLNDSAPALSQQFFFRLMLGSRCMERQKRRHASLPE